MMEYNQAQEEAIRIHEGQLLLISCPGSGKTTTMLRRIADMTESGIDPSGILMVTFMEAAAREMRERYRRDYGSSTVHFSTIHSLAFRILRENGYGEMQVLAGEAQRKMAAELIRSFSKNPYDTSVKDLLLNISAFKNKDIPLQDFECSNLDKEDFKKIFPLYENRKKVLGQIDFDDMLLYCRSILREKTSVCMQYQSLFPYLICDEYQDTNVVQRDILYLLAGKDGNLCVVGDDDQSIYGFRGAESRIMLNFKRDFPKAKLIYMDTNYRSLPEIVEQSRRLIEHNRQRFPKEIHAFRKGNATLEVLKAESREAQLSLLFQKVEDLNSRGKALRDMAILTRTNAQLEDIAAFFEARNISYSSGEAIRDPYEHFIFRDLLCYFRLIQGERRKEDLLRVLNRPKHYVKLQSVQELESFTDYDLLRLMSAQYSSAPWIVNGFRDYLKVIQELRDTPFLEQLMGILDKINYRAYLKDYAESSDTELSSLEAKLAFYIQEAKQYPNLSSWYQAAVSHVNRHREVVRRREREGIRLSTMHQAKGLEWDTVFIPDLIMGVTPSPLSRSFSQWEEERRLFYVAVTRARNRLYLLHYNENQAKPSLYLREMKEDATIEKEQRERPRSEVRKSQKDIATYQRYSTKAAGKSRQSFFREGSSSMFRIGDAVHHLKFGEGKVVAVSDTTVTVDFSGSQKIFKR